MFTGLVEAVGKVTAVTTRRGARRLSIAAALPGGPYAQGESIAVDGVCLTVSAFGADAFQADAIPETLSRTTLGDLRAGRPVNLERALRLGDRLGGHLVQGHVDATARVREVRAGGADYRLRIELPEALRRFVAFKGSVAVHGVSLTVSAAADDAFEVALVPETLARTTLGRLRRGDRVNVEVDLLARYLERLAAWPAVPAPRPGDPDGVS